MWLVLNGQYRKLCWTALLSRTPIFTVCATSLSLNRWPPDQNRSSPDWNASVTTQLSSKLSLSTNVLDVFLFSVNDACHGFPNSFTRLTKSIMTFTICLTPSLLFPLIHFTFLGYNFKLAILSVWNSFPFALSVLSILWGSGHIKRRCSSPLDNLETWGELNVAWLFISFNIRK